MAARGAACEVGRAVTATAITFLCDEVGVGPLYGHGHLGHPDEVSGPTGVDGNQADYAAWIADTPRFPDVFEGSFYERKKIHGIRK